MGLYGQMWLSPAPTCCTISSHMLTVCRVMGPTVPEADVSSPEQMDQVDVHPDVHRATEPDEEEVLRELYGDPDENGFYLAVPDDTEDEEEGT